MVSTYETNLPADWINTLGDAIIEHIDLNLLLKNIPEISFPAPSEPVIFPSPKVRIAIARDAAFCFYYEDNFRLLQKAGAELVEFSILHDTKLPHKIHAIYIGGGFPEEHAKKLSENTKMREAIRTFPNVVWAECGGMMYLCESFLDEKNIAYPMCGRISGKQKCRAIWQVLGAEKCF